MTGSTGSTGARGIAGTDVYALPNGTSYLWASYQIGTLTTAQEGRMFKIEFTTQNSYAADPSAFATAELIFSTSNGTQYVAGNDGSNFFGCASVRFNSNVAGYNETCFAVQQNSPTSYSFYTFMLSYPGRGMLK